MTTEVINNSILLIQIGEGRGINGGKSNFTLYISGGTNKNETRRHGNKFI